MPKTIENKVQTFPGLHHEDKETRSVGRPGKIKRLVLRNFMCHEHLVFHFEGNLNFVSGKNGSGKSAILAALMLGLGGKAINTNRATSVKSLIKYGKSRATIEITLYNTSGRSYNPYRYELYGDEITIVRSFTEKSSSYKFMSNKGKIIATRVEELKIICNSFNIQVTNPVAILDQETARTFMAAPDPQKNYDFFMKGSLLEKIDRKYDRLVKTELPALENKLVRIKEVMEFSHKEIIEIKQIMERKKQLQDAESEIILAKNELLWAKVVEMDNQIEEKELFNSILEEEVETLREMIDETHVVEKRLRDKKSASETDIQEITKYIRNIETEIFDLEQNYEKQCRNVTQIKTDISRFKNQICKEKNTLKELEDEIEKEKSYSAEKQAKREELKKKKSEVEERIKVIEAIKKVNVSDKQQLLDTIEDLNQKVSETESTIEYLTKTIGRKSNHLSVLMSNRNELSIYSPWMISLVMALKTATAEGKLTKMPFGPIGRYIKVKEECWAAAVEETLSYSFLCSFCLNHMNDWEVFKDICEKLEIPRKEIPGVIVSKFITKPHNCKKEEAVHPQYINLLRIITVSNPVVFNAIVDNKNIENILLVPTLDEAFELFGEDMETVPPKCSRAVTLDGDTLYPLPNLRLYCGTLQSSSKARILQTNRKTAIRVMSEGLEKLKFELESVEETQRTIKNDIQSKSDKVGVLSNAILELVKEINDCEVMIKKIEIDEEVNDIDLNILLGDQKVIEERMKKYEQSLSIKEQEAAVTLSYCDEIRNKKKEFVNIKEEKRKEIVNLETSIFSIKEEIFILIEGKSRNRFLHAEKQNVLKEAHNRLSCLQKEHAILKAAAEQVCPQMCQVREVSTLLNKIHELKGIIKSLRNLLEGKKCRSISNYETRLENYERSNHSFQECQSVFSDLSTLIVNWKHVIKRCRKLTCMRIKDAFMRSLRLRHYKGDISFDHSNKQLIIFVETTDRAIGSSDTSGLSGGERSYSMVSFIMALWTSMNLPFYFLDEFDVFMDPVNRTISLHLFIDHARRRPYSQFVFLTPHAAPEGNCGKIPKFILEDPRKPSSSIP